MAARTALLMGALVTYFFLSLGIGIGDFKLTPVVNVINGEELTVMIKGTDGSGSHTANDTDRLRMNMKRYKVVTWDTMMVRGTFAINVDR